MTRKMIAVIVAVILLLPRAVSCRAAEKKVSEAEMSGNQIILTISGLSEQECTVLLAGYNGDGQLLLCSPGTQQEEAWVFQVRETASALWYVYFLDPDTCAPLYSAENITKLLKRPYGEVPIYLGEPQIDYMAEEILKEIDVAGKSDRDRILAVYDWIIVNCRSYSTNDTLYFDTDEVEAESKDFYEHMLKALEAGEITSRIDVASGMTQQDGNTVVLHCDANDYVAPAASQMMLYRFGQTHHFAGLLTVLLGHLGYDCRMIEGEFINNNGSTASHTWKMVLLDGEYLWLDVRMDHANYQRTGSLKHSYFLVEDTETWETRHSWDHTYSDALMNCIDLLLEAYGLTLQ